MKHTTTEAGNPELIAMGAAATLLTALAMGAGLLLGALAWSVPV